MNINRPFTRYLRPYRLSALAACLMLLLCVVPSCTEEVDTSARYVFRDKTVADYLQSHPENYSEYCDLLLRVPVSPVSRTTVWQLLTARGNYTVFAPTNEAVHDYLAYLAETELIDRPAWDAFADSTKLDSIRRVIVMNSIIDGGDLEEQIYYTYNFPVQNNAELPLASLNDHKLTIYRPERSTDSIYVNGLCPMDLNNRDIPAINGAVHMMHRVIAPNDLLATAYLQSILEEQREGILLMARVLQACGLFDTLSAYRDEVYETKYLLGQIPDMEDYQAKSGGDKSATSGDPDAHAPEHRKFGFTIFAETDDFWRSQGIDPTAPDALQQLQQWILDKGMYLSDSPYTTDADYRSPRNLLYQWVTYHVLPMRIPTDKLVYHCNEVGYNLSNPYRYSIPVYEWYCTMGDRRLLKLYESAESKGVYLNRFPNLDNVRRGNGHELGCDPDKTGSLVMRDHELTEVSNIVNACIYPIDAPLAYTDAVRNNLGKERIRIDLFAMFPEAITNGIRRADSSEGKHQHVYIPQDGVYKYFSNMSILNEETHFIHYNGYRINWANYCQDEDKAFGRFDIRFTLPPVPKTGTYELRYKTLATGSRGVVQTYFGSNPDNLPVTGIPIDMTKGILNLYGESNDIADTGDEEIDAEIDHKLRNHSVMKSARHEVHENNSSLTARDDTRCTRHVLWRGTLEAGRTYYLRFKSVLDSDRKELYLDYIEFCPKEVYDNPAVPEDVW